MSSPKEVIENIRKTRFGIGFNAENLSDDQKAYMQDKKKILEDAARLASEIYSRKPHFIFELIQNAEDNIYEKSIEPKVKFIVKSDVLVIQNNEKGFNEKNIWALCGIGESTKTKASGYIGEKGIGFKSVFMVTDEPHIYSNGYQFKFKHDKEEPVSIIIPRWVDEVPDFVDSTQSNIVLPLKSEVKGEISRYLDQIHSSLLLFLQKLEMIEFEDQIQHKHEKIERHNYDTKVEIARGGEEGYWRMIKQSLEIPGHIEEERRRGIHKTEMILAFPLNEDGTAEASNEQFVFAFLPIRKYGFKFIIQADFLLPISREDIIKDNHWNKWLRGSIVTVFLNAVNEFKADKKLRSTFYNYLAFEEVRDEFFLPVKDQIYESLKRTECILTETNLWRKPSDVLVGDEERKNLVPNEDLKSFFGKEYLSSKIKVKKSILGKLGIEEFSNKNLIKCLENTQWVTKQGGEWFVSLYRYLSKQELSEELLERLKGLDIIRLENEEVTSVNDGVIFFPLDNKGDDYGFEGELRIINRNIIDLIAKYEKQNKEPVLRFLKRLGIQVPNPYEIIESHILPVYENDIWKEKNSTVLLGYVRYIKENIEKYEGESNRRLNANKKSWEAKQDPLERLKKSLFVRIDKTTEGEKGYDHPKNIYLSKIYGNENDLETLFEGIGVNFVHPCYVEDISREFKEVTNSLNVKLRSRSKGWKEKHKREVKRIKGKVKKIEEKKSEKLKEWGKFFVKLVVNKIPRVSVEGQTRKHFNYTTHRVKFYSSTDLCDILKRHDIVKNKKVFTILDKNWDYYCQFIEWIDYYHYYTWKKDPKKADWFKLITEAECLPTSRGTLEKPSNVFQDKPEIRKVLGNTVTYLAVEIENPGFIGAIGINVKICVVWALNYLKELVKQKCEERTKFEKMYSFLNKHFEEDIIREAFSESVLIYIPNTEKRFFASGEVLWKDESDIFGENRGYLEKHYPSFKNFFVERVGVSEKPSPKDYADVLVDLSQKDEVSNKDEQTVLKIYEELNYYLNPDKVEEPISEKDWWTDFIGKAIFFVENKEFWNNDGDVLINDDPKLYERFREEKDVAFFLLPEGYHPQRIRFFIESTRLRYLSKSVKTLPNIDESSCSKRKGFTKQIRDYITYIIRYLCWKEYPRYENLRENDFFQRIENLEVYAVDELRVEYVIQIQNDKTISTKDTKPCLLYKDKVYVSKKFESDMDYVAIELSKIFGEIKGLDDFVISLFEKRTKDKIENLMSAKGIPELQEPHKGISESGSSQTVEQEKTAPEQESEETTLTEEHTEIQIGKGTGHPPSSVDTGKSIEPRKPWTPICNPKEAHIKVTYYEPQRVLSPLTSKRDKEGGVSSSQNPPPTSWPPPSKKQDIMSEADKKAIGRYGEELTLKCLKEEKGDEYSDAQAIDTEDGFVIERDGKSLVEVIWLNKYADRGVGYDIKLIEDHTEYYIEAKSTVTEETDWFDVSKAQWELMQKTGDNFWVYRVYNTGTRKPKLVKIKNPAKLWRKGKLIAYPVRIQI